LSAAFVASAGPASAIPAFARRYKVECHFCHDGFPKLNVMGQRFKERGFRMEREDAFDASAWLRSVPLTIRAEGTRSLQEKGDDFTYGFFKGISAGNLGRRLAYWVDDAVFVSKDDTTHVKPDNGWLRAEIVTGGKLYAKAGRFELDLPFSQARTPHLLSYEIYSFNTGLERDNIGEHQEGLEVGGDLPQDVHWSAAVVKGRNTEQAERFTSEAGKFDGNLFLRLAKRISQNRIGAFAYIGRNTLATAPNVTFRDDLLRVGADASVWAQRLNLYGVYMYGKNDNSTGTGKSLSFNGGFLQADYHIGDAAAVTLRVNAMSQPTGSTGAKQTFTSLYPGLQIFIFHQGKLSFEYGFLNKDRPSFGAVQAEVAF
jgi:hypothetical protein